MSNPKRKIFSKTLKNLDSNNFEEKNILSSDLSEKVGNLEEKSKITIKLEARIIEEAKKESKKLGVGYQKIINDHLLDFFHLRNLPICKIMKNHQSNPLKS